MLQLIYHLASIVLFAFFLSMWSTKTTADKVIRFILIVIIILDTLVLYEDYLKFIK